MQKDQRVIRILGEIKSLAEDPRTPAVTKKDLLEDLHDGLQCWILRVAEDLDDSELENPNDSSRPA